MDNAIVVIYLLLILLLGLYSRSNTKELSGYGKIEKKLSNNKLILLATIFSTSVGGGTTFGISQKAFTDNIAYSYALLLTVVIDIAIAVYLIPRIIKFYGAVTTGDIMERYYGVTGKIITGTAASLVSIGYLAAQISVSARIFEYFVNLNYFSSVILSYVIVVIYTTAGGLRATIIIDIMQFFLIMLTIPLLLIFSIYHIGGLHEFINLIPPAKYSFNTDMNRTIFFATLSFSVMGLHPTFLQKILITQNVQAMQISVYRKIVVYIIFIVMITAIGCATAIIDEHTTPNIQALPYLIDYIIPLGLKGLVIAGLLASVMSTADSDLNVASIAIVNDIYKPLSGNNNQQVLLIIAKFVTAIIGSLAIIIALTFQNIMELILFVAGFWSPVVFVPLIGLLFNITVSHKTFILSTICATSSFCIWHIYFEKLYQINGVFIGTVVSFLIFIIGYAISHLNKNNLS